MSSIVCNFISVDNSYQHSYQIRRETAARTAFHDGDNSIHKLILDAYAGMCMDMLYGHLDPLCIADLRAHLFCRNARRNPGSWQKSGAPIPTLHSRALIARAHPKERLLFHRNSHPILESIDLKNLPDINPKLLEKEP